MKKSLVMCCLLMPLMAFAADKQVVTREAGVVEAVVDAGMDPAVKPRDDGHVPRDDVAGNGNGIGYREIHETRPVYNALMTALQMIQTAIDNFKIDNGWIYVLEDVKDRLQETELKQQKAYREKDCTQVASGIHDLQCTIADDKFHLLRFQFTSHDVMLPMDERNLYVFVYADGRYMGANYTGEFAAE